MGNVVVVFNHFKALAKALPYAGDAACKVIAEAIPPEAQRLQAKDTTHMSKSNYVITHDDSTYSQVDQGGPLNPEIAHPPLGESDAVNAATYVVPVEYGTRYQAAQPGFTQAAYKVANHPPADLGEKFMAELKRRAAL